MVIYYLSNCIHYLKRHCVADDLLGQYICFYTPVIMQCVNILFLVRGTFLIQILCWTPHQWKTDWDKYTNSYCFLTEKYDNKSLVKVGSISNSIYQKFTHYETTDYYQWMPLIIGSMSFILRLPHWLWKIVTKHQNFDVNDFIRSCITMKISKKSKSLVTAILNTYSDQLCICHLYVWFLLMKILTLICLALVLIMMHIIFFGSNRLGPLALLYRLFSAHTETRVNSRELLDPFPLTVQCVVNHAGSMAMLRHTVVGCNLPLNLMHEKVVLLLWLWLCLLISLLTLSIVQWLYRLWGKPFKYDFEVKYIISQHRATFIKNRQILKFLLYSCKSVVYTKSIFEEVKINYK